MATAAHMLALAITVVLVTSHVVDAQPRAVSRRAGPTNGNNKALGRDPDPARLPPGRDQKVLPAGQTGALGSRRADAFDASYNLVEDEVRRSKRFLDSITLQSQWRVVACSLLRVGCMAAAAVVPVQSPFGTDNGYTREMKCSPDKAANGNYRCNACSWQAIVVWRWQ
jgi:hypothetical protein